MGVVGERQIETCRHALRGILTREESPGLDDLRMSRAFRVTEEISDGGRSSDRFGNS